MGIDLAKYPFDLFDFITLELSLSEIISQIKETYEKWL